MSEIKQQIVNELHKEARKNFQRRGVVIKVWGDLFQSDLVDMQHYKKYNKGYEYILFVVDVFTKMAYAEALKDKTAKEVVAAMSRILERAPKFRNLQTDEGKEYVNSDFRALMTSKTLIITRHICV
jgi:hypothetical protein